MIFKAFPKSLYRDILIVLLLIPFKFSNLIYNLDKKYFNFKLNKDNIKVPYRYQSFNIPKNIFSKLSTNQKKILYCINSRSLSGYTREKYISKILDEPIEEWEIPFIIKLCDDYLIETLEEIYKKLKDRDNTDIKNFCLNNKNEINKTYSRMVSYWNEYYRHIDFNEYVGNKIFVECLGYNKK